MQNKEQEAICTISKAVEEVWIQAFWFHSPRFSHYIKVFYVLIERSSYIFFDLSFLHICCPSISHFFPRWGKDKIAKDMLFKVSEYLYLNLQVTYLCVHNHI